MTTRRNPGDTGELWDEGVLEDAIFRCVNDDRTLLRLDSWMSKLLVEVFPLGIDFQDRFGKPWWFGIWAKSFVVGEFQSKIVGEKKANWCAPLRSMLPYDSRKASASMIPWGNFKQMNYLNKTRKTWKSPLGIPCRTLSFSKASVRAFQASETLGELMLDDV